MNAFDQFDAVDSRIADALDQIAPARSPHYLAEVLKSLEATQQRRRLVVSGPWRSSRMNRLTLAAAAVVAVALVGSGVIVGRLTAPSVGGPSPSVVPSSSPSSAATTDLPASLIGKWYGPNKGATGLDLAGTALFVGPESIGVAPSNAGNLRLFTADAQMESGRLVVTAARATAGDCQVGQVGTYAASLSPSGETMTLAFINDACPVRPAIIGGTWWRADCPLAGDNCLGKLDAGSYGSEFFGSYFAQGQTWVPAYGGVRYTVPEGWANDTDLPARFGLSLATDFTATSPPSPDPAAGIRVVANVGAESQASACSGKPDETVPQTVDGVLDFIRGLPSLHASAPRPMKIGGWTGTSLDLSVVPSRLPSCADGSRIEYLYSAGWTGARNEARVAFRPGERQRLVLIDMGAGHLIAIVVFADESRFDQFAAEAMPVVQSLTFPGLPH